MYQQNLVSSARYNLLAVLIFTAVNLVMLLTGSDSYFLFSATLPYYLTYFGYMFDHFILSTFTLTGLVMAAVFLGGVLLCWLLSKKHSSWFIVGLVLMGIDALAMVVLMLLTGSFMEWLLDIVFHGWVIFSLSRGIAAAAKLKSMPEQIQYTLQMEPEQENTTVDIE